MVFASDKQRKGFFGNRGLVKSQLQPFAEKRRAAKLPKTVSNFISKEISRQRKEGRPQKQSIAIAFSKAKKKFPSQRNKLEIMGNPNRNMSQKRIMNLLVLLFGTAVALSILRRTRN